MSQGRPNTKPLKAMSPYQDIKFNEFLKLIRKGEIKNWSAIAAALEISKNTITAWKRDPRAAEAIAEGIEHALEQMEKTGAKDWRMWHERAKMLGVTIPQQVENRVKLEDPILLLLAKFGLEIHNDGQTDKAEETTPQSGP